MAQNWLASLLQVVARSTAHANQNTFVELTDAVVTAGRHAHPTAGVKHCVTERIVRPPVVEDSHDEQNGN